jgi:AmmeMemoRadiSam system protein B/AmmeMemoRadiSam system protein A
MTAVHTSPYAGSWYPGHRAELEHLLETLFQSSLERTGPALLPAPAGFVVPHAGLEYSGSVAASACRCLQAAAPKRVILLGFSHRGMGEGVAMPAVERIETPLGEVAVDTSFTVFPRVPESRLCDHSVEIQLPLLQKVLPGVPVVPLYVGTLLAKERREAAEALAGAMHSGDVLVASSDFTHYGRAFGYTPFPVNEQTPHRLHDLDFTVIEGASSLDAEFFLDTLTDSGSTTCGHAPISLLLETLTSAYGDALYQETLDYQTSGDITGDSGHCVSYAALGYFPASSFRLEESDRQALLQSARATLEHVRSTGKRKPILPENPSPALGRPAAVFVSLHQGEELLGCIGSRSTSDPLFSSVPEATLSAALDDPRFAPAASVSGEIEIEISVLTPMKRIRKPEAFELGRHGAYMEFGLRHALLLPQVAEYGFKTPEQFLQALCRKVGLPTDSYTKPNARLSVFEAQVFH